MRYRRAGRDTDGGDNFYTIVVRRVGLHHRLARGGIHQFVHQAQTGHGVFGVADGFAITRGDLLLRELCGKRGSAH